jgi:hypothetical protein
MHTQWTIVSPRGCKTKAKSIEIQFIEGQNRYLWQSAMGVFHVVFGF